MSDERPAEGAAWERKVLTDLAMAGIIEQRRARRWGNFFKILFALYIGMLLVLPKTISYLAQDEDHGNHVAVVDVSGPIASGAPASSERLVQALRKAFSAEGAQAVMLRINSPGGSPVQSDIVYDEIVRLKEAHPDLPVYAVGTDMMTSGAYYIAAAADEIYANEASLVGSIGVMMSSFGFDGLIDKLGVERRLYTAGDHKGFADPFLPAEGETVTHMQGVINEIHAQFIQVVTEGRGSRIDPTANPDLFSGLVWTGARSAELGLIDGFASDRSLAEDIAGTGEMVVYNERQGFSILKTLLSTAVDVVIRTVSEQQGVRLH